MLYNLQRSAIRSRHEESISYEKKKKFADTLLFLIVQLTFGMNSIGCRSKLPCTTSNSQIFPTPMCQHLYWCEYSLILFSGLPKYHNQTGAYFGKRQFSKYVYPSYIKDLTIVSKVFNGYTKTMKTTVKPRKGLVELLVSMGVWWVILGKALQSMFAE